MLSFCSEAGWLTEMRDDEEAFQFHVTESGNTTVGVQNTDTLASTVCVFGGGGGNSQTSTVIVEWHFTKNPISIEPHTGLKVQFWQDDLKPQEHHWKSCSGEPWGSQSGPSWNPSNMKASTFVASLKLCFYFVIVGPGVDGWKWLMSFWILT